ncbi:hypothetical protein B566_EDAN003986 [Ephemera danica]|nr:hypothetical protein B566_EDAN003986 [Ephemera danica]
MCVLEVEASRLEARAVAVIHLEEAGEEGVVAVAEEAVITLLHAVAEAEEVGIVSRLHQPAMSIVAAAVLADTMESPGFMGMEMAPSHHRSPDSPRKRMRSDQGYHQASSHHRSHESSSFDYGNSRYGGGYEEKNYDRYREERRNYRDHHSGERERYSPRDEYLHHRKEMKEVMDRHDMGRSSMPPPPPPMNPRHSASPRRSSFRGRGGLERGRGSRGRSSIRGSTRGSRSSLSIRKQDGIGSVKRKSLAEASYTIKKKILSTRTSQEHLKKLRMQKIRRIKENIENLESQEVTEETKKDDWEADETAIKEEKEAPVEKAKEEVEKAEEVEAPVNKDEEAAPPEIKEEVESSVQVTIQQNMDGRAVNEETVHKSPISSGKRFIRLQCPHCHERCITFKQYTAHLYGSKHLSAMSRLLLRQKQTVLRLRQQQRKQQREEEEREADSLTKFSSFCSVCKLNYRQAPITHTASKMHQEMKKLLFPYCKVCGILFKATLIYDKHICSLDHIRREAYMEERLKVMEIRSRSKYAEELEGDEKPEDKQSIESLVGLEFVKKVEALYCDLCQRYLPRLDDVERAQGVHCRSSQHIRLFMDQERLNRTKSRATEEADGAPSKDDSFNENEKEGADLEDGAEVHGSEGGEEVTENGKEEGGKDADDEQMAEGTAEDTGVEKEEEVAEEKLWADVDKDLGELLRDVDPEEEEEEEEDPAIKSSDDDESVAESGRYDRFRYSEKLDPAKDLEGKQEAIKNSDPVANDDTTK